MASDSDVLSYLLPLDELIQVIYQGSSRFVVISGVEDTSWTVHVGLSGSDGRWWRGRWTEKDILKAVVRQVFQDEVMLLRHYTLFMVNHPLTSLSGVKGLIEDA